MTKKRTLQDGDWSADVSPLHARHVEEPPQEPERSEQEGEE